MSLIQEAKRAARDHLPGMYARWAAREKRRLPEQIPAIVSSPMPYKYCDEATFSRLQKEFAQVWPDYSESEFSNWRRAVDRVAYIVQLPTFAGRSGLKMLEAACSDGMTGKAFAGYGYEVTLHDLQDWREPRNKSLDFVGGDLCQPLPIAENSFDIICSWNSFEHVPDPAAALAELLRICKPGGHIYLWFNPLWCSPLGLHALKFTMPYPQFLFSEELIETKMRELAGDAGGGDHWSHHKKHVDLMNKVRLATFREIWKNSGGEVVFLNETRNDQHLNVVANFPQAFTGRGLTLEDLVTDGIEVLLRKPER